MSRHYPPEALALFAEYRERRAAYRPAECHQASPCWVEDGPPSMTSRGTCAGCGVPPRRIIILEGNADARL